MRAGTLFGPRRETRGPWQKLAALNWGIVVVLAGLAGIGMAMLYSVGEGSFEPWALRQGVRFAAMLPLLLVIALIDLRTWLWLAYPAYAAGLVLLLAVEVIGVVGMGGQRWLDLGVFQLQPGELMKIGTVMALARYYHGLTPQQSRGLRHLLVPVILIALPCFFLLRQPDLGTALMLAAAAVVVVYLAGVSKWLFIGGAAAAGAAIPLAVGMLREYQKARLLTFLNPESDPSGAGYQIIQSKIALGSGGVSGKGFLEGTQSHLNFLPEMKTDFIFTVLAEEFGLLGGLTVLALYAIPIFYAVYVGMTCRNQFGRLLAGGLAFTIFLYLFINVAMVMGLLPVVGVPLPLISYGGSAMLTVMTAMGLVFSAALNRRLIIPRASYGARLVAAAQGAWPPPGEACVPGGRFRIEMRARLRCPSGNLSKSF